MTCCRPEPQCAVANIPKRDNGHFFGHVNISVDFENLMNVSIHNDTEGWTRGDRTFNCIPGIIGYVYPGK